MPNETLPSLIYTLMFALSVNLLVDRAAMHSNSGGVSFHLPKRKTFDIHGITIVFGLSRSVSYIMSVKI